MANTPSEIRRLDRKIDHTLCKERIPSLLHGPEIQRSERRNIHGEYPHIYDRYKQCIIKKGGNESPPFCIKP